MFRRAVLDGVLDPERTVQIGIRGRASFIWDFSYDSGMRVITADDVTLDLMAQIFRDVLERKPEEQPQGVVERRDVTVEEKVELLTEQIQGHSTVSFRAFISQCRSRVEVIVSFMAVLELIKSLELRAEQDVVFGDISLVKIVQASTPADA